MTYFGPWLPVLLCQCAICARSRCSASRAMGGGGRVERRRCAAGSRATIVSAIARATAGNRRFPLCLSDNSGRHGAPLAEVCAGQSGQRRPVRRHDVEPTRNIRVVGAPRCRSNTAKTSQSDVDRMPCSSFASGAILAAVYPPTSGARTPPTTSHEPIMTGDDMTRARSSRPSFPSPARGSSRGVIPRRPRREPCRQLRPLPTNPPIDEKLP